MKLYYDYPDYKERLREAILAETYPALVPTAEAEQETPEEADDFSDIDPAAIREQLEQGENPAADTILEQAGRTYRESEIPAPERFILIETDGGYAVWDDVRDGIYVDEDGNTEEFDNEWQAESYLLQLKEAVSRIEAREWLYEERARNGVEDNLTERQQRIIEAMEKGGFLYDPAQSRPGTSEALVFTAGEYSSPLTFGDWDHAYAWIDGAELKDTPGLRSEVQEILHPDRWILPEATAVNREAPEPAPQEPVYQVGDTVYLDGKPFTVEEIGLFDVQLRDPSLLYPIFRAENKDNLEQMLRQDERNNWLFDRANQEEVSGVGAEQTQEETPASPDAEVSEPTPEPVVTVTTQTVFSAEKTHLPFDVVFEKNAL